VGAAVRTSGRSSSSWTTSLDVAVGLRATARGPIEVAAAGDGPAVLLVHGIPGSWRQCIPLAEDLEGFRCLLPSRPGYGRTPASTGRSYDEQADALVALLDAFGIEKCAVVGLSGGGPIAIALAVRHHERASALVMACAMAPHLITAPLPMRLAKVPGVAEVLGGAIRARGRLRVRRPEVVDAQITKPLTVLERRLVASDPRVRTDLVRHELGHLEAPLGLPGLRNDLAQIERAKRMPPPSFAGVSCPTLVMHGERDTVIGTSHARFYADGLPDADVAVFDDSGHLFALTRRRECSAAIRAFLERTLEPVALASR
jgi:pimeloyl-ACP methyl ester carboxylesterase